METDYQKVVKHLLETALASNATTLSLSVDGGQYLLTIQLDKKEE